MDLLHLVDRLEELVAGSQKMPIGGRAIVDRRRLFDLIDQMRVAIPDEVREAQRIVEQREELQRESEEEARMIVARAEEQAARLVDEHQVTISARVHADEVAAEAGRRLEERITEANEEIQQRLGSSRTVSTQQMTAADEYAGELLRRLERQLQAFVRSVQAGLQQIADVPRPPAAEDAGAISAGETPPALEGLDAAEAGSDEPSPLARLRPVDPTDRGETAGGADESPADAPVELTDLLHPVGGEAARGGPSGAGAAGEDVIDDFSLPGLDDEPGLKGEDGGDEAERPERPEHDGQR